MKTLYFEGAGWPDADRSKATNVGNCRIRTAFTNDDGRQIYLEMSSGKERITKGKKLVETGKHVVFISHMFYITGDHDDCNKNSIPHDWQQVKLMEYTKENITSWVNQNLNCSFDTMETLDDMEYYRVHADNRDYNLMENHVVNSERTKARNEAYQIIDKVYCEHCQEKYSVIGLKSMDNDTITIYCHSKAYNSNFRHQQLKDNKPRTATVNIWTKEVTYKEENL